MIPINILILPLLGGYYFLVTCELSRYYHQRIDRQKLIFNSAFGGTVLIGLSFIAGYIVENLFPGIEKCLTPLTPLRNTYFWTSTFALLLGVGLSHMINWIVPRINMIERAIIKEGNHLEIILFRCMQNSELCQFTLHNNKVYVGWIKEIPLPGKSRYISIIPAISGYRTPKKLRIKFTTQYLEVYSEYVKEGKIRELDDLNVEIVICEEEVISAGVFDIEMWDRFHTIDNNPENSGIEKPDAN